MTDNEDKIKQYLLDNYEHIIKELTPVIQRRDELLKSQQHHILDIKDQFRHYCGSVIIQMVNKDCPDIPLEDVIISIRTIDMDHFITLDIKELLNNE